MRLICPNCDAEYEVDAALIPEGGRDVQCSACGHSWFQMPPDVMAAEAEEAALYDAAPAAEAPAPAAAPQAAEPVRAGRTLDDSVLAVLKEEADREAAARRAERPNLETQTEMPLSGTAARAAPPVEIEAPAATQARAEPPEAAAATKVGPATMALQKIARLRGQPEPRPEPVKTAAASRRDLFPGIDEVNSTLRASGERREADLGAVSDTLDEDGPASHGFRNGFLTVMILVILGAFLYVFAPVIESQVPAVAKPMAAYVQGVDDVRVTLDELAKGLIIKLQGITRGQG